MDDDGVFCDVDDKVCPFTVMSMTKAGKLPMHCGLKLSPQRVAEKYQDRPFGPFRPLSETILHMVVITISVNASEYDEYCLTLETF